MNEGGRRSGDFATFNAIPGIEFEVARLNFGGFADPDM